MTTLAQDSFTRADQSNWGTSSGGQTWANVGGPGTYRILSNRGRIGNFNGYTINRLGSGTAADVDIEVSLNLGDSSLNGAGIAWRVADINNGYRLITFDNSLYLDKFVSGTRTNITNVFIGFSNSDQLRMRVQHSGSTLKCNLWLLSGGEPAWAITVTENSISSAGYYGLISDLFGGTGAGEMQYYDFIVTDGVTSTNATVSHPLRLKARTQVIPSLPLRLKTRTQAILSTPLRLKARTQVTQSLPLRLRARTQAITSLPLRLRARTQSIVSHPLRLLARTQAVVSLPLRLKARTQALASLPLRLVARTQTAASHPLRLRARTQAIVSLPLRLSSVGTALRTLPLRLGARTQQVQSLPLRLRARTQVIHSLPLRLVGQGRVTVSLPLRLKTRIQVIASLPLRVAVSTGVLVHRSHPLRLRARTQAVRSLTLRVLSHSLEDLIDRIASTQAKVGFTANESAVVPIYGGSTVYQIGGVPLALFPTACTAPRRMGSQVPLGTTFALCFAATNETLFGQFPDNTHTSLRFPMEDGQVAQAQVLIRSQQIGSFLQVDCTLLETIHVS